MSGAARSTRQHGSDTMDVDATYPDTTRVFTGSQDEGLDGLVEAEKIKLIVSIGDKKRKKEYDLNREHVQFQSGLVSTILDQDPGATKVDIWFLQNYDDEKLCEKIADAMLDYIEQMKNKKSKPIPIPLASTRLPSNTDIKFIDDRFDTMRELKTFFYFASYMEMKPLVANVGAKIAAELLPYKAHPTVIRDPSANEILERLKDDHRFKKEREKPQGAHVQTMAIEGAVRRPAAFLATRQDG